MSRFFPPPTIWTPPFIRHCRVPTLFWGYKTSLEGTVTGINACGDVISFSELRLNWHYMHCNYITLVEQACSNIRICWTTFFARLSKQHFVVNKERLLTYKHFTLWGASVCFALNFIQSNKTCQVIKSVTKVNGRTIAVHGFVLGLIFLL